MVISYLNQNTESADKDRCLADKKWARASGTFVF